MSMLLFEIANNPKCQINLREEINKHCVENGGKLSYENIQSMAYLDACVNGKI